VFLHFDSDIRYHSFIRVRLNIEQQEDEHDTNMTGRKSVQLLASCSKLGECMVRDIKPRPPASLSSTRKPFHYPVFYPTPTSTAASRRSVSSQAENDIKKTPLFQLHVSKKAKFVPFGGYSMPLYYDDLSHVESHHWTREKASIFDVSHM
jgi:Aminomethyltransferase folate-binding domain